MDELTDCIITCPFEDLVDKKFPINKRFGLVVYVNDVKYEFLINFRDDSNKLLVLGSGAFERGDDWDRTRPRFDRQSWALKYSTIYYNDPTLYLDNNILGGWGVGTKDDWYLEKIASIISLLAKNVGIFNENILFYGSSAAGFMSIILSILVKNSQALAEIPQFDLYNYWRDHWNNFKRYCFPNMSDEEMLEEYGYRFNIINLIKYTNYIPRLVLLLDFSVLVDFEMQYIPFLKELSELNYSFEDYIKIIIHGKNLGHFPLYENEMVSLIYNIFDDDYKIFGSKDSLDKGYLSELGLLNPDFDKHISINNFLDIDDNLWVPEEGVFMDFSQNFIKFYHEMPSTSKGVTLNYDLPINFKIKLKFHFSEIVNFYIGDDPIVNFRHYRLGYDLPVDDGWQNIEFIRENTSVIVKINDEIVKINFSSANSFSIKVFGADNSVCFKDFKIKIL